MKLEIIIPNYNGSSLLKAHLPQVIKHSPKATITVIDDASSDDSVSFLKDNYPKINLITNPLNLGFTKTVNKAFKASSAEIIVLLNNDVEPKKDYLKNALKYFDSNPKLFALTLNETGSSWPQVSWSKGKLQFTQGQDKRHAHFSAWASGGSSLIRKTIWDKLSGFNEIYSPGYWEDNDLGWRAWKAGYQIIWANDATVNHLHESTFGKLNSNYVSRIKQRNELLFLWQNFTDKDILLSHFAFLLSHTLTHPGYLKVILSALLKYSQTLKSRHLYAHPALTDAEVLQLINKTVS